jgi:hypothetical protein
MELAKQEILDAIKHLQAAAKLGETFGDIDDLELIHMADSCGSLIEQAQDILDSLETAKENA